MLALWVVVEVLPGISLAYIVRRFAVVVGLVLTLAGMAPAAFLMAFMYFVPPTGDMSSESMLSTLILVTVAPAGIAAFPAGLIRRT